MFRNPVVLIVVVLAVAGGSVLLSGGGDMSKGADWLKSLLAQKRDSDFNPEDGLAFFDGDPPIGSPTPIPGVTSGGTGHATGRTLAEVVRFDVTPNWVMQGWPEFSSHMSKDGLTIMRVTLLTGTKVEDFAGSMTYSYDQKHVLQRMTLEGNTGDPTQLISLATQQFGMTRESGSVGGTGIYVARWHRRAFSAMKCELAGPINANRPHLRYMVTMEINRPDSVRGLSAESKKWVPPPPSGPRQST